MKRLKKLTFWILGVTLVLGYIYFLAGRDLIRILNGDKVIMIATQIKKQEISFSSNYAISTILTLKQ